MIWFGGLSLATLGFFAGMLAVNVLGFTDGHEGSVTPMQIRKMEEALTVYAAKHKGRFPERLEDAAKYFPDGEVPTDAWGRPFVYFTALEREPYVILSLGRDGKVGGEGLDEDVSSSRWEGG